MAVSKHPFYQRAVRRKNISPMQAGYCMAVDEQMRIALGDETWSKLVRTASNGKMSYQLKMPDQRLRDHATASFEAHFSNLNCSHPVRPIRVDFETVVFALHFLIGLGNVEMEETVPDHLGNAVFTKVPLHAVK